MKERVAVILFNLGGPDKPEAVQPFLQNLFSDPAIIALPGFVRKPLARFIAARRAPYAKLIYEKIGGKSPILEQTTNQAAALEEAFGDSEKYKIFTVMRYWHPRAASVVQQVKAWNPDSVVLLPLYPQFSTTTSESSIQEWKEEAKKEGLNIPTFSVCCYPTEPSLIAAHTALIREALTTVPANETPRILFSAHGLPEKTVRGGDPYQWQVEQSVEAVVSALALPETDYRICYQSRVGPLKWIGPSTAEEIGRAGEDGRAVILVPIAFVSEHSETLVELDIQFRALAEEKGEKCYIRVPALQTDSLFIQSLKSIVLHTLSQRERKICAVSGTCPSLFKRCLNNRFLVANI